MSVEALLLLALFIGLPLIEQVIKQARRRRAVLAAEAEAAAKRGGVQRTALERPPDAVPPQLTIPRSIARLTPSPQRPRAQVGARRDRLRRVGELREAIVMRVILGPCRALDVRGDEPPA